MIQFRRPDINIQVEFDMFVIDPPAGDIGMHADRVIPYVVSVIAHSIRSESDMNKKTRKGERGIEGRRGKRSGTRRDGQTGIRQGLEK